MPLKHTHTIKAVEPHLLYIYDITREFLDEWGASFSTYAQELKAGTSLAALENALETGDVATVIQGMPWSAADDKLLFGWRPLLEQVMARAGAAEIARLRLPIKWDIQNPYALRWIEQHGAELVTQVGEETKAAIRAVVLEGFEQGNPPRRMARRIREMVGLTERDAKAVDRYWRTLTEEADLSARRVDDMADVYAKKLLNQRGVRIARHETVSAASNGQLNSWYEARSANLISPESKRLWLAAAASDRTCEICMDLHGQKAGLDEPFYSKVLGQEVFAPPAHITCRCSCGLLSDVA